VTGTSARTATNDRAGAHGPLAGMLHSVFVLLFMLIAAPLASYIPVASLAGVLTVVAWTMIDKQAFVTLLRVSRGDAAVLIATFLLTIFRDLTEAIVVGFALGSVLFIHRMSKTTAIETHRPFVTEDRADDANGDRKPYDESLSANQDVVIYRISGAFFFGAAASIGAILDRIADTHKAMIIDLKAVPFVDSTAANTIEGLARKARSRKVRVILTGTSPLVRKELFGHGIKPPMVFYERTIESAISKLRLSSS
jgi:SulP family sulfate permease